MSISVVGRSTFSFIRSISVVPPATNFAWGAERHSERAFNVTDFLVLECLHDVSSLRMLRALARFLHRGNDVGISAAAADVAAHAFADRVVVFAARLLQQRDRRHDLAGGAVAALESVVLQERGLHGMQFAVRAPNLRWW